MWPSQEMFPILFHKASLDLVMEEDGSLVALNIASSAPRDMPFLRTVT